MSHRAFFIAFVLMSVFCGHKTPRAIASVTGAAETVDCLPAMNEARTAAGLAAFEKATDELQSLPQSSPPGRNITAETLWNEICEEMAGTQSDRTEAEKLKGTFAYYEGENDCKAAVQYWKDGFSLFNNEIPPKYQAPNNPKVYDNRAVSFVALYNPKENPVASCAFVTCTTAESVAAPSMSKSHSGRASRRLQEKPTTAVVCLTNPAALTANEAPFKEGEWQKIVHAIVGTEMGNGILPVRLSLAPVFLMAILVYSLL